MLTLTIRKEKGNPRELTVFISEKLVDKLVNALYPPKERGNSKGYIMLTNFLHKD